MAGPLTNALVLGLSKGNRGRAGISIVGTFSWKYHENHGEVKYLKLQLGKYSPFGK